MTNKEAIEFLSQIMDSLLASNSWLPSTHNPIKESFGMAINALTAQPETHACDCVSKTSVCEILADIYPTDGEKVVAVKEVDKAYEAIQQLPSAQPETEWNNHTVACLLAELFGDACACNYNGIDEWLPEKCEAIDACPNPVGVACWEQFLKHRAERRTDGKNT